MLVDKAFILAQCLSSAVNKGTKLLLQPGDAITPFNTDIPVYPAAVAYPSTEQEISNIVKCAAQGGLHVQARSGGHGYANYAYGGGMKDVITIDMANMKQFSMNYTNWQATTGPGFQLGELDEKLIENGHRAVAHGVCPSVGVGGHATIGGLGPPSRMWGSLLDHVLEVRAVIANGSIITASPTQNSDIFWAIKGAGPSFAIVTSFKLRTQKAPGWSVSYKFTFDFSSWPDIGQVFKRWQKYISNPDLDRKFASMVILSPVGMIITGTYFGSEAEFASLGLEDVFPKQGYNANVTVFQNWLGVVAQWGEDQVLAALNGKHAPFYANSVTVSKSQVWSDELVDKVFAYMKNPKGTPVWFTIMDLSGGAISDVPLDATAYSHRDALFYVQSYAIGIGGVNKVTKNFFTGLNKVVTDGLGGQPLPVYPGYIDPLLKDPQERYWGPHLPRLEKIKAAWDPNSVFKTPQSIKPFVQ